MLKNSTVLLVCVLLSLNDLGVLYGQFAGETGTIHDLAISPDTVDIRSEQGQLTASFMLETVSDFESGLIYFINPEDKTYHTSFRRGTKDPRFGEYEVAFTLDKYHAGGRWRVHRVYLQTASDNETISIPQGEAPNFYVLSNTADTSPPTFTELQIQPDTLDVGNGHQYVQVTVQIDDDITGFVTGTVYVRPEGAPGSDLSHPYRVIRGADRIEGDTLSGVYQIAIRIGSDAEVGRWVVNGIALRDNLDNFRQYSADDYSFVVTSTGSGPPSPDVPQLIAPADGAEKLPRDNTLVFNRIEDNAGYWAQVALDPSFGNVVLSHIVATPSDQIQVAFQNGAPGRTYYWRVRAQVGSQVKPWSQTRQFTINELPGPPTTISPANDDVVEADAIFSWRSSDNVEKYELRLIDAAAEESMHLTTPDTTFKPEGLRGGTEYQWSVRSHNNVGQSEWSEEVSFSTALTAPEAVSLSSPGDEATNQPIPVLLEWQDVSSAAVYAAEVSRTMDFSGVVFRADTLTRSTVQVDLLDNEATYFWRARAGNDGGWGEWSEVRSFTTVVAAPLAVALSAPTDEAVSQPLTLELAWQEADGADVYEAQLATAADFAEPVYSADDLTEASVEVGPLDHETTYFWRVRAGNDGGWGEWSEVRSFITAATATSAEAEYVPTTLALHQNYPNPFNPVTTIVFDLPKASHVKLSIYSITGAEVATLIDTVLPATRHEIQWDARGWPSGTYIYSIRAGDRSLSRRMILVK